MPCVSGKNSEDSPANIARATNVDSTRLSPTDSATKTSSIGERRAPKRPKALAEPEVTERILVGKSSEQYRNICSAKNRHKEVCQR